MKKLLVLLVVLGLVTSAQATLTLSLSKTSIAVGETTVLTVNSDISGADGIWKGDAILSEDLVNWTASAFADLQGSWTITGAGDQGSATVYPACPTTYTLNAAGTSVLPTAGNQFQITYVGVAAGTTYVDLQDDSTFTEMANGPLTLVVTPEPMTMALLGLGGLFLRRKK